jgi:Mrp family chromosome partitioning ATPase/capsular polysaccharide biosynthesis protein
LENTEPTLLSAAWRHRWLVLVVTALVVALGLIYYFVRPQEEIFEATATAVIQEPLATAEAATGQGSSAQYIGSQLQIMRSPVVSEAATEILVEAGFPVTVDEVAGTVTIVGSDDSPLVTIIAQAPSAEQAVAVANAVAEGYREVSQRQSSAVTEAQLERIDAQVEGINQRLAEIEDELAQLVAEDEALFALQATAREAVSQIAALQEELLTAEGEEADAIRQRIEDYRLARTLYNEVATASSGNPEQQALLEEQAGQVDRRARLLIRRDEIAIDASLAPDAFALVQQANEATRLGGLGLSRLIAVTLILGLGAGIGLAYFLSVWRRTFSSRREPAAVLGAPLLVDIPDFVQEGLDSQVPARDNPRSAAAEAFRFASSTTEAAARSAEARSIFFASATIGHGKTTTAVNVAVAAAYNGRRVLLVDSDFGSQEAAFLLAGEGHTALAGMTDVIEGTASQAEATHSIVLGNGIELDIMPRGTRPSLAAAVFQSQPARDLIGDLTKNYDLVLIDGPPVLQVAYAASLADIAEGLVVIVEHQSSHAELVDLRGRLELISTPILGYIYNRSPLRREMTMSEGSMMDILGDAGFTSDSARQRRPQG